MVAAVALAGCVTVGPDYRAPDTALPAGWTSVSTSETNGLVAASGDAIRASAEHSRWWEAFRDPALAVLIERACVSNLNVRQAEARLRQARAQRGLTVAEQAPSLSANASAGRTRTRAADGSLSSASSYAAALDASWEIDLFGGKRRAVESADATLAASAADLADVLVSLTAEVALNYVTYRSCERRIDITESNLLVQSETYAITRWRHQANLVSQLDVEQAQVSVEQTRAERPALRVALAQAEHQIATLLGVPPGAARVLLQGGAGVPRASASIAVGVPADLLRRRPDVRRAERKLAAQTAQLGVAAAERFPDFTLSGSVGLEALALGDLYSAGTRVAQGALRSGWKLVDGGQIRQKIAVQTALQEEALGAYEAAVLAALKEVENALVGYAGEWERRNTLLAAEEAARRAFGLARDTYASGLVDFQTVLDTQQALLKIQDSAATSDADVTSNLIRLYKALGGGWDATAAQSAKARISL